MCLNKTINTFFLLFFCAVLLIVLGWLLFCSIAGIRYFVFDGIYDLPLEPVWVLGGAFLFIALLVRLKRYLSQWSEKNCKRIVVGLLIFLVCVQLLCAIFFTVKPSLWDFGTVFDTAIALTEGQTTLGHYYYDDYPNNIGITLLLAGIFQLFFKLGYHQPYMIGMLLNIMMIDLALIFLYLTARQIYGVKSATLIGILGIGFLPFLMYVPIYYSDTLSLPFGIGAIFFYLRGSVQKGFKKYRWLILCAVFCMLGFIIKPTLLIVMMAICLHMLLVERFLGFFIKASTILAIVIVGIYVYQWGIDQSKLLPIPIKQAGYPSTHWVMMGISEPFGFYNADDVLYTESFQSKEQRKAANLRVINNRLRQYKVSGLIKLFFAKTVFVWGDGTYFAPVKLQRGVSRYCAFHPYVLPLKAGSNRLYIYWSQIVQLGILLLIALSAFWDFKSKSISRVNILRMVLLGTGIFLLIWEARSRYLINVAPMLLLCAMDGLVKLEERQSEGQHRVE